MGVVRRGRLGKQVAVRSLQYFVEVERVAELTRRVNLDHLARRAHAEPVDINLQHMWQFLYAHELLGVLLPVRLVLICVLTSELLGGEKRSQSLFDGVRFLQVEL